MPFTDLVPRALTPVRFAITLLCAGCGASRPSQGTLSHSLLRGESIALQRGPCVGACSVYDVVFLASGSAIYRGYAPSPLVGRYRASLPRQTFEALAREFADSGFFNLKS